MRQTTVVVAALLVATALTPGVVAAGGAAPGVQAQSPSNTQAVAGTTTAPAPARLATPGASQADCSYPVTLTDATGTEVTIDGEPQRVVTLNPSAAQTMYEIGAWEKVVGVSQFAGFLPGADERTTVTQGQPAKVQVETVIGLNPDLVIAPNTTPADAVDKLRQAGITVYKFEAAASIEDVYEKTREFGPLSGNCEEAEATASEMERRIGEISDRMADIDSPRTLYLLQGGYTPGPGSFIHEMITTAGGHNIAADANITFYGQISNEVIVEEDPEVLIVAYYGGQPPEEPRSLLPDNEALRQTTAYEENNVIAVDANNISQPAPRIVSAIETLSSGFQAYVESQTTPTATPTPTPTATQTENGESQTTVMTATATPTASATTTDDEAGSSDGGGLPGFGVPAALAALVALAGLATRRGRH